MDEEDRYVEIRVPTPEGGTRVEVFDLQNPDDAEALRRTQAVTGSLGQEASLQTPESLAANAQELEIQQRQRALAEQPLGATAPAAALGLGRAATFGAVDHLMDPEEIAAIEREAGGTALAAEVAADLGLAFVAGGEGLASGLSRLTAGGASEAAAQFVQRQMVRRLARRGLTGGANRFLSGTAAQLAAGGVDLGGRAVAAMAITGDPAEAEAIMGAGGLVAALGLGTEGLAALTRAGGRALRRGAAALPREAAEQMDVLARSELGMSEGPLARARAQGEAVPPGSIADLQAPEASIPGERLIAAAGGQVAGNRQNLRRLFANPEVALDQGARQRIARQAAERINAVRDDLAGALAPSVFNAGTRERLLREAVSGLGGEGGDALRTEISRRLDGIEAGGALGERDLARLREHTGRIRRAVETGDAERAVVSLDQALSEAARARRSLDPVADAELAVAIDSATREARESLTALGPLGANTDGLALAAQRLGLLEEAGRAGFDGRFAPSGRVESANLQRVFDEDAVAAVGSREGMLEAERWLDRVERALDVQELTDGVLPAGSRARVAEIRNDLEALREAAQLNAADRVLSSGESKGAQLMAAFGFGGAALGSVFGGPVGGLVGSGLGIGLAAATHPVGLARRVAAIKSNLLRSETRAGQGLRRLSGALRGDRRSRVTTDIGRGTRIVGTARRNAPRLVSRLLDRETRDREYAAVVDELRRIGGNPSDLAARLEVLVGGLAEAEPMLAAGAAATMQRGIQHLLMNLPPSPGEGVLFGSLRDRRASPADARDLARRLHVLADPWVVLELAADGRLNRAHAEAFADVYPELHAAASGLVAELVAELDRPPPFHVRTQVALLLGLEDDPSIDPAFVARLQTPRAQTPAQQAQMPASPSFSLSRSVSDGARTLSQSVSAELP